MSCRPSVQPVPKELLDVLYDGEEEVEEDDAVIEEEEEVDDQKFDIENMPVFLVNNERGLDAIGPSGDFAPNSADLDSDSEDEEEVPLHRLEEDAISPLSAPTRSPVTADDAEQPQASTCSGLPAFRIQIGPERGPRARRGSSIRGRGRGHGRGRQPATIVRDGRQWVRGQPLQEVYINDADFPPNVRQQIQSHLLRVKSERQEVEELGEDDEGDEKFDVNEEFEWRGMDSWTGKREVFDSESSGPTQEFNNSYDAMHAIWTDEIMTHIVHESNRYVQSTLIQRARVARDWFDTNIHEVWCLFAFWIMLGIIRMPSIKSCFTRIPILKTDVFRHLFTETRYWHLNAAFHLAGDPDPDNPLHAMGPIIDHLNGRFQELYRLQQDVCIDESLTLWKGPLRFRQYIKTKSARFGIKSYQLCESATGYLWSFFIYVGRTAGQELPASVSTVLKLIRPLLNLGHTLFMDNWFNSPTLARWLKRRKTDCVGTLRANRKQVPSVIKNSLLREGQFVAQASDDVMVVAIQDRFKRVTCISTYHDVSQVYKEVRPGHPAQYKLRLVDDYNKKMGGVDRLDQMLEAYLVERKQCRKWNTKLFKRLLNVSIQNSRIIVEKNTRSACDSLAFRLSLVEEIIKRHLPHVPRRPDPKATKRNPIFPLSRLTGRHFVRRIPITDKMRQNVVHRSNLGRRVCVWCTHNGRRRSKTAYECSECQLPLCLEPCFKDFHNTPL